MRILSVASIAAVAIALLAGCAGGSQGPVSAMPGGGATPAQRAVRWPHTPYPNGTSGLYISDAGTNQVEVVNNAFNKSLGAIGGFGCPGADVLDSAGNLYVVDSCRDVIDEFPLGATSPSFTYSTGMTYPTSVGVDSGGNVYETDGTGIVNEYAQGSNTVLYTCSTTGDTVGVAVDRTGDVFVEYDKQGTAAFIAEYKNGLNGCRKKRLGVQLLLASGMTIDKNENLVVGQFNNNSVGATGAVDVIEPPYSSITTSLSSGYHHPTSVALNKANDLAFVVDSGTVYVLNYPSGSLDTTLTSGELGLSNPVYAVDGPNAAY